MIDLDGLPVADRVRQALRDMEHGKWSKEALWLVPAAPRLRWSGIELPGRPHPPEPELAFYEILRAEGGDPYSRYNAWRAELESFLSALEGRVRRREATAARAGSSTFHSGAAGR